MSDEITPNENDNSVAGLIHRIKINALDPKMLTKEQRQACAQALYLDSCSPTWIAQFLQVSDRTLRRDMKEIKTQNALTPDPALARELIGEFLLFSRIRMGTLMKLSRNTSASTSERAQCLLYAHQIDSDLISKLQSLGYLPKSAESLLVLQKTVENDADARVTALFAELEDMSKLETNPKKAKKLIALKKIVEKEKPRDPEQQ